MVYLIGVDHKVQYTNDYTDVLLVESFAQYLKGQAKRLKVTLIAEEFNQEAISKSKAKACTARDVAKKLGIEHRFCDPDCSEREAVGIPSRHKIREQLGLPPFVKDEQLEEQEKRISEEEKKYWDKREQFWFHKIKDKLHERIIFICGDAHLESFRSLLNNGGYEVKILSKNWGG